MISRLNSFQNGLTSVRFSSSESLSVVWINAANAGPIVIIGIHRTINNRFNKIKSATNVAKCQNLLS